MERNNFGTFDPALAVNFIKQWEGFSSKAYMCPAGVLTIGYGHTAGVTMDSEISKDEAELLLVDDLKSVSEDLARFVNVPVTRGQYVALMSLAFNIGVRRMIRTCPKLIRALNDQRFNDCSNEFLDVVKADGKVLPGLVLRRQAEAREFQRDY